MNMTIGRKIGLGFSSLLALMTIHAVVVVVCTHDMHHQFSSVIQHDAPVIANARHLLKLVVDMETGQRGFVITGNPSFLEPYDSAKGTFWNLLEDEKALVSDNPSQVRRLENIDTLVLKWQAKAAMPEIELRRSASQANIANLIESGTGKRILDSIREEFRLFTEEEERLMKGRFAAATLAASTTQLVSISLTLISLVFGGIAALWIINNITKRIHCLVNALGTVAKTKRCQEVETDSEAVENKTGDCLDMTFLTSSSDEIGQLSGTFIQMQDRLEAASSEQKQATSELQKRAIIIEQSEARLQTIMESASEGIVTIDTRGTVESFNKAAVGLFGYRAEEVVGQNVMMLMPSPHTEQHDQYLANYLRTGDAKVIGNKREVEGRRKDGTLFPMELNVSEVEMDDSHLFTAIVRDLTQQNQIQAERAQAQKLESVGQLAAGIAHEINTPIQYMGDNTRFLKEGFGDINTVLDSFEKLLQAAEAGTVDEPLLAEVEAACKLADVEFLRAEIPQAIDQSLKGVERVAKIVRAMKEFSHPGSDEKSLVNLTEAIKTTITVAANEWKYVAEMVTEFDPELPSVACLPGELNQVFLNLIVNAAHAIGDALGNDSTEKGTITVGTRWDGEWAEIFVRDTGTGIPEAVRAKIFDPFFTTKEVGKGTGQGLAIARSVIVEKHNGEIDCKTEQGQGTTFIVRLPINEEQQTQGAENVSENERSIR